MVSMAFTIRCPAGSPAHTHAAHRVQQLLFERIVDLAAQPPDGHFHQVGVAVEIHVPHLLSQLRARQHVALAAHEQGQQRELLGGQLEPMSVARGLARNHIEAQVLEHVVRHLVQLAATQEGLDSGEQFGEGERLGKIVVRTALESAHPIGYFVTRCQHQHRHRSGFAHCIQHRKAVDARKHHVENQKVVVPI